MWSFLIPHALLNVLLSSHIASARNDHIFPLSLLLALVEAGKKPTSQAKQCGKYRDMAAIMNKVLEK